MSRSAQTAAAIAAASFLLGLGSCAAAGKPPAGAVAYVGGDLEGRLDASPQRVVQASEAAFEEMDIRLISADATGIDGKVIGRTALDKKIEITARRDADTSCKVSIRVDTFGDEALSRQIFEKIRSKL